MKELNTLIKNCGTLRFGDFILLQLYKRQGYDRNIECYRYEIMKPTLALFLGLMPCDQTIGMEYVPWLKNDFNRSPELEQHVEWDDYIDILGHWSDRPTFKELRNAFRKQMPIGVILESSIKWD